MIEKEVGEGICVKCGSKIENQKCPICDRKKSWKCMISTSSLY